MGAGEASLFLKIAAQQLPSRRRLDDEERAALVEVIAFYELLAEWVRGALALTPPEATVH